MFYKFQTQCSTVYEDLLCKPLRALAVKKPTCAVPLTCDNGGLKECGQQYYAFVPATAAGGGAGGGGGGAGRGGGGTAGTQRASRETKLPIRCCSSAASAGGGGGAITVVSSGLGGLVTVGEDKQCAGAMAWPEGDRFCKQAGKRLCTIDELKAAPTSGAGTCGYGSEVVWSVTKVPPPSSPAPASIPSPSPVSTPVSTPSPANAPAPPAPAPVSLSPSPSKPTAPSPLASPLPSPTPSPSSLPSPSPSPSGFVDNGGGTGGGSNNQNGDGGQAGTDNVGTAEGSNANGTGVVGGTSSLEVIIGVSAGGLILMMIIIAAAVVECRRNKEAAEDKLPRAVGEGEGRNEGGGLEMGYNNNPMDRSNNNDGRPLSCAPTTPRPKTPSTPRGALPAGWAATLDMSSGETYYYNEETGETQWEVPEHDKRMSAPRKQQENTW